MHLTNLNFENKCTGVKLATSCITELTMTKKIFKCILIKLIINKSIIKGTKMYQGDHTGVWFVSRNNCVTQSKTKVFQLQILNFKSTQI